MTNEEKQILLKDLCTRLPYGVVVLDEPAGHFGKLLRIDIDSVYYDGEEEEELQTIWNVKSYLRPMSSMTGSEKIIYEELSLYHEELGEYILTLETFDWLNANHFDYRGLIPMGLALEAPEGMYKTE